MGGRFPAGVWFTTLMVLVNMVMLNMLLAIIVDVYSGIKDGMDDNAETIWSQSYEILGRWRDKRKGSTLPLDAILNQLEDDREGCFNMKKEPPQVKLLTLSGLLSIVDGLKTE